MLNISPEPFVQVVPRGLNYVLTNVPVLMPSLKVHYYQQLRVISLLIAATFGYITYTSRIRISRPRSSWLWFNIQTSVSVLIHYLSLLSVNSSYVWLAVFPVIAIGFIFALHSELNRPRRSQQQQTDGEGSGSSEEVAAVRLMSPTLPLMCLIADCAVGQTEISDTFVISNFLVFINLMLLALIPWMTQLAMTRVAPGIAQASVLLQRASFLVLLATVHTIAAELLGENVMLFILPELVPILLWFSLHLDRCDGSFITADKIKTYTNMISTFGAAVATVVLALLLAVSSMEDFMLYWCMKAMVSFGVSGALLYCIIFVLLHWPGPEDSTATAFVDEAVKLLKLYANILLIVTALLMLPFKAVVLHGRPA